MTRDPGLACWLQLTLTPGISASGLRDLLKRFGLPQAVLAHSRSTLSPFVSREALAALDSDPVSQAVDKALAWVQKPGHSILTLADSGYPAALLEIADPPPLLYLRGRADLLAGPCLAVVGSRNATPQGMRDAESFARAFSASGLTIVSGLAQGIDAAAHLGGLSAPGSTIAVLGTGVDLLYPKKNAVLGERIADEGLLVSEFPLSTPAVAYNFPRRNRLISGLSRGCLVIEAAIASGSLITARAAADQGRDVFAIPGSIHSPLAKGCHSLIKTGAKLVESAEDVLAELPGLRSTRPAGAPLSRESARREPLLEQMGPDPVDVDSLCARANMGAEEIAADLLRLELAGKVAALPGGLFQRLN